MPKLDREGAPSGREEHAKARPFFNLQTWKGQVHAQKWPRRRGPITSPVQQAWVDNFSCMAKLFKSPDPFTFEAANFWSKDSGWFWRDYMAAAAGGKVFRYNPSEVKVTTPTANVHRTTAQSIPNTGAPTVLTQNVVDWDNYQFVDALNPSRLTFRQAGLYLVGASCNWNAVAGSWRSLTIRLNGAFLAGTTNLGSSSGTQQANCMRIYYFNESDYIEAYGAALSSGVTCLLSYLQVVAITPEAVV